MRRTKIVATIGPATSSLVRITDLISAGMDVARLNFSHGTHEEHAERITWIRQAASQLGRPVAILQDLQGPKIRTGPLEGKLPLNLEAGSRLVITTDEILGRPGLISTTYDGLPADVKPGDRILLSDGLIELRCIGVESNQVVTEVINGGILRTYQGINLPGVAVSAPSMTEKDLEDLHFGLQHGVDYVAISFVRRAEDVEQVKQAIAAAGKRTPVVAKIEKPEAVMNIEAIIAACDAVMVARGDLGVELPAEQVPLVQKSIIGEANRQGKPVITATQMLESMVHHPRPTRAEASDVANAIIDGTDAVMLSAETATGEYPIRAVEMMARIALVTEASGRKASHIPDHQADQPPTSDTYSHAISHAACAITQAIPIAAIIAFTQSGYTAHLVARERPTVPIIAMTPDEQVYRQLALVWGVQPVLSPYIDRLDTLSDAACDMALRQGYARTGESVVVTGGHPLAARGVTNFLKILELRPTSH